MQDLHSIGNQGLISYQHQDLKCPRCDSLNTKFCYYNNYNLCQPRHFCRSCRRYWTKGGVLRNVPVGGAIRKPKRSSAKLNSKTTLASSETVPGPLILQNSSGNSASVTANTISVNIAPTTKGTTTLDVSRSSSSSTNSTPTMLLSFNEPSTTSLFNFSDSSSQVTTMDPIIMNQNTSPKIGMCKFQQENHLQWTEIEQMAEIDYKGLETANQGLFDQSYWNQNHWDDNHQFS